MATLTVKIPQPLQARLDALVARRGQSKSDLVREAIERLVTEPQAPEGTSVLDLLRDLKETRGALRISRIIVAMAGARYRSLRRSNVGLVEREGLEPSTPAL